MVDLIYVKKRKRKKIAAIVSAVSSMGLAIFVIISFLGRNVGTYTIGLKNNDVKLTLSTHSDFRESSSYLRVNNVAKLNTFSYQDFKVEGQLDFSSIDNENTSYLDNANLDSKGNVVDVPFFKYTFFIKNEGRTNARYTMSLKITDNTPDPDTGKYLDEILRVVLIEDSNYDDFKVYAMRSSDGRHYSEENPEVKTDLEYICGKPGESFYEGLAEAFYNSNTIFEHSVTDFASDDIHQYTLLYWLEGWDEQAVNSQPRNSKIRLGVEINAYEN